MAIMDIERLEAKLFDLRQDVIDNAIDHCRCYLDTGLYVDIQELDKVYLLLNKMVVSSGDIDRTIHMFYSAVKQGVDLNASYKKLLNEYALVKDE